MYRSYEWVRSVVCSKIKSVKGRYKNLAYKVVIKGHLMQINFLILHPIKIRELVERCKMILFTRDQMTKNVHNNKNR